MLSRVGTSDMHKAETPDGTICFIRSSDGGTVTFTLSYRDPEQRGPVERTRQGITAAVDGLRDKAIGEMRAVIERLVAGLQPELSQDGRHDDFVDPAFDASATTWTSGMADGEIVVRIKPYLASIQDNAASGHADSFLAEEYTRAIVRRRIAELTEIFEELRRDLLGDLEGEA